MKEAAKELLKTYLEKFDDDNFSDEDLKEWLDEVWIPAVRDFLEQA